MSESTPLLPTPDSNQQRRGFNCHPRLLRLILPATIAAVFLIFILTVVVIDGSRHRLPWQKHPDVVFPNFSHYKYVETLPNTLFPLHPDDEKRIIVVGDIHGMNDSLGILLANVSYNPQTDTLMHVGDLVPKSKWTSPVPVLSFMTTHKIIGVRGNNDQKVLEWKAWMYWIETMPGGKEWLGDMDSWSHIDGDEPAAAFHSWLTTLDKDWYAYIPDGWKLQGKHYKSARALSREHFDYLCSLPILLYAPVVHTYFVHAGVLPADPTRAQDDPRQPLTHLPAPASPDEGDLALRGLQELALLSEVPQNHDPWVLLNMRSITEDGDIVKSNKKGMPWSNYWNDVMNTCSPAAESPGTKHDLTARHCFPSMVVYGHAAARDLDVKRWSIGLDSGCAFGRRLTALILDNKSFPPQNHSTTTGAALSQNLQTPYGDNGTCNIVSIDCDY